VKDREKSAEHDEKQAGGETTPTFSGSIESGLEREQKLKKIEEELDAKYSADLARKTKPTEAKNKKLPWIASAAALFMISGLSAFGPELFAYLAFSGSSLFLGIEGVRYLLRETPEEKAEREKKEKEKAERSEKEKIETEKKTLAKKQRLAEEAYNKWLASVKAAAQTPALSLTKAIKVYELKKAELVKAQIVSYNDEHHIIKFQDGKGTSGATVHLEPESYFHCIKDTNHFLWYIIDAWEKLHD